MARMLSHDGGSGGGFRFDQNPKPKSIKQKFNESYKAKPKPSPSKAYGNGNLNKLVKKYNPPKKSYAAPKKAAPKAAPKRSGGTTGSGGKFYKNGYVDSKGNKVVNGRWVTPKKQGSSGGGPIKSSAPKTNYKAPAAKSAPKTIAAPKPAPKKKVSLLADDYLDQIYRNQIGELDASDAAYTEDNKAKSNRLGRDFNLNNDNVALNKTNSLQNSAEDYAARGMMRSGAYGENLVQTTKMFDDQKARMQQNFSDDSSEFSRAKADYLRGSQTQRQDAKRQQADRIAVENAKRAANASS